ncbi:MAG: hypothetical protein N2167_02495 [Flavobacteriales bacterium]|nr:hypothetical protein [Flavobacteriales bacterium]
MKKILIYLLVASFGVIAATSCKTKEHCPAYGQKTEATKAVNI